MTPDKKPCRILIIEDNPGDFVIISEYLHEAFLKPVIHQASTFKEAKLLLEGIKRFFDIILLDLTLPDKSGTELISEIMLLSQDCPIIVLTGYSDIAFSIKSLSLGISDYLLKDELSSPPLYKSIVYSIERKKTLSTLTESEKRYSDLFHLSPQPMWVTDLETLHFLDVNNAALSHYQYSREEFFQMPISEIWPKEDLHQLDELLTTLRQHDQFLFQGIVRHKKKNGEIINVEIHSNTILFKGKKARLGLINDVTERIKYIGAIEKQNVKLKEIAWVQSHIVRAPLARMMGVMGLIKELKTAPSEFKELLGHLADSSTELDIIIRDIAAKTDRIDIE